MPTDADALFSFLLAGLLALLLVPLTKRVAERVGAIDYPSERKLHLAPTPLDASTDFRRRGTRGAVDGQIGSGLSPAVPAAWIAAS